MVAQSTLGMQLPVEASCLPTMQFPGYQRALAQKAIGRVRGSDAKSGTHATTLTAHDVLLFRRSGMALLAVTPGDQPDAAS